MTEQNKTETATVSRRNELNAEYVRLTKLKIQVENTLRNIDVALGELDRVDAEAKKE